MDLSLPLVVALVEAAQMHIAAAQQQIDALVAHVNATAGQGSTPIPTNVPTPGKVEAQIAARPPQSPEGCAHPVERERDMSTFNSPRRIFCRACGRKYEQDDETGAWHERA